MGRYPDRGLHGHAVQDIGSKIVSRQLPAGSILSIEQLCADMGVSRTVIREAVKVLAAKGLVGARQKHGTFVRPREEWNLLDPDVLRWQLEALPSVEMLDKLAEVRMMIEPAAAAVAADRRIDLDLKALENALDDMAAKEDNGPAFVEADVRFHRALLTATRNEFVEQMSTMIGPALEFRDAYVHQHVPAADSVANHRTVIEAIRDRDGARARDAMQTLLSSATSDVRRVLDSGSAAGPSTRSRARRKS